MNDWCVEFAQPYTLRGEDAQACLVALKAQLRELKNAGKSYSLVVLVDDCSYPDRDFDFDSYATWLQARGVQPDLVLRESQIRTTVKTVIDSATDSQRKAEYQKNYDRPLPSASLFVAAWYLIRLGSITEDAFPGALVGHRIKNVLPRVFKPDEDAALDIIRATPWRADLEKIDYVFTGPGDPEKT